MIWILPLAFLSGVLGRCGGASKTGKWYDFIIKSITRDLGCSLIVVAVCWIMFGWHPLVYLAMFGLHWAAFSTYWDSVFGYDNLWFSGLIVGLAAFPLCFIDQMFCWIVPVRMAVLCVSWGCLNKYLPEKGIWIWRRDVVEEFSRYTISL